MTIISKSPPVNEELEDGGAAKPPASSSYPYSFSFAGCGFRGVYHIGAVECMQTYIPHILEKSRFAGASAGALVACCLICKVPLDTTVTHILELIRKAYNCNLGAFDPDLHVTSLLRDVLESSLPENAHELCSGRLFVSVSRLRSLNLLLFKRMISNDIISQFSSRKQLIETLLYSSYIPVFSGSDNPVLDKEITMDGAFSNNLPQLDENTVLVCPLAGETHISPRDERPPLFTRKMSNNSLAFSVPNMVRLATCFFLPPVEELQDTYHEGFTDTLRYLMESGLIACEAHHDSEPCADCAQCKQRAQQAGKPQNFTLDPKFEKLKQSLPVEERRHCEFSMSELMRFTLGLPKEVLVQSLTSVRFFVNLGFSLARLKVQVVRDLLNGKEKEQVLAECLGEFSSEQNILRMIFFRTRTLMLFRALSKSMHVVDYGKQSRLYAWLETFILKLKDKGFMNLARNKNKNHHHTANHRHSQEGRDADFEADYYSSDDEDMMQEGWCEANDFSFSEGWSSSEEECSTSEDEEASCSSDEDLSNGQEQEALEDLLFVLASENWDMSTDQKAGGGDTGLTKATQTLDDWALTNVQPGGGDGGMTTATDQLVKKMEKAPYTRYPPRCMYNFRCPDLL